MSDITPQAPQGQFQAFPGEMPPATPTQEPEAYQSLSLLALLGFCLAVLASAMVVLGGLVPLYQNWTAVFYVTLLLAPLIAVAFGGALRGERKPERIATQAGIGVLVWAVVMGLVGLIISASIESWSLGWYFWLPAVASVVLCLLGWAFIANSEGTVTGEWYARWGIFLSLFFSLIYVAYGSSISLAMAAQARERAREFVDRLKEGDTLEAYILTTRPSTRGTVKRAQAEADNARGGPQAGSYTLFCASDAARLFGVAGGDVTLTETRYEVLPSKPGQSVVRLDYHVQTPFHEFDMGVVLASEELLSADRVRRRDWHVMFRPPSANTPEETSSPHVSAVKPTQAWSPYAAAGQKAEKALAPFLEKVTGTGKARPDNVMDFDGTWKFEPAHLMQVRTALEAMFAGKPTKTIALQPMTDGRQQFVPPSFEPSDDGKKITVKYDMRADIGGVKGRPEFVAEGKLYVEGPLGNEKGDFKVTKLKWDRVRKVETPQGGPQGGPPGGGPPG